MTTDDNSIWQKGVSTIFNSERSDNPQLMAAKQEKVWRFRYPMYQFLRER